MNSPHAEHEAWRVVTSSSTLGMVSAPHRLQWSVMRFSIARSSVTRGGPLHQLGMDVKRPAMPVPLHFRNGVSAAPLTVERDALQHRPFVSHATAAPCADTSCVRLPPLRLQFLPTLVPALLECHVWHVSSRYALSQLP